MLVSLADRGSPSQSCQVHGRVVWHSNVPRVATMVITILPDGQGTHYSMNAIWGNSVLMWLGDLCVFLFRHDVMLTCLVPIYMYMGIRSVLVSLVSSIRAWVRSFQLGHQHLFGVPLEMALNHHFMKEDMCVCVCSTC